MKKLILLVVFVFVSGWISANTDFDSENVFITNKIHSSKSSDEALHFHEQRSSVTRFAQVELNQKLISSSALREGDQILINLFDHVEYLSYVHRTYDNINGTNTIIAKLADYSHAYAVLTQNDDRALVNILIPETNRFYQVISDPESLDHYLLKMNAEDRDILKSAPPEIHDVIDKKELEAAQKRIQKHIEEKGLGPEDPANITVLIAYTEFAKNWANNHGGGIENIMAQAMAKAQLVMDNSETLITMTLVHSGLVNYTESGSYSIDLMRFATIGDGYMPEVHQWRDQYAADLCALFLDISGVGGVARSLNDRYGRPSSGFSLTRAQQASFTTHIHEMGHNMGLHHHKEQNFQPGPMNWLNWPENTWSAGWRWTGADGGHYCSIMSYCSGSFFDDDISHIKVPYFSNPSVSYEGVPTGHPADGDNARTLLEIKHVIASYRIPPDDGGGEPMVMVFDTDLGEGTTITLPLHGTVNATVDWGDGNEESFSTAGFKSHTYDVDGTYTVKIHGTVQHYGYDYNSANPEPYENVEKLEKVVSFGDIGMVSLRAAFAGAINLQELPPDLPSRVMRLDGMLAYASSFNDDISSWDVGNVIRMKSLFLEAQSFDQHIGEWNVSNVSDMSFMFKGSGFNQDISSWDVSNVNFMQSMFKNTHFDQDIGSWDVSRAVNMASLFKGSDFNQDIGHWNVSNVTDMSSMFANADFDQDIGSWDVSSVVHMEFVFYRSKFNHDIGSWDVSNVTSMESMFKGSDFNQDIASWDVSSVVLMQSMFSESPFNQDIGSWDVSNVIQMAEMFSYSDFNQDISSWDVSNVRFFHGFLLNSELSAEFYNKLLIMWSYLDLEKYVGFDGGDSQYDLGLPEERRQYLLDEYNWWISDGGTREETFQRFHLHIVTNPEGFGDVAGNGIYDEGDVAEISATAAGFYEFDNWEASAGTIEDPEAPQTLFTMPDEHMTLKANLKHKELEPGYFYFTIQTSNTQTDFKFVVDDANEMTIDWGDGTTDHLSGSVVEPAHDYGEEGIWLVKISGEASRVGFFTGNWSERHYPSMLTGITPIGQGVSGMNSTKEMFAYSNVGDFWRDDFLDDVLTEITDMEAMFYNSNFNQDIGSWDVSNVKNMESMFRESDFNQDIGSWDVSNVTNMESMFYRSDFNQDIGSWDVSSVTNMRAVFRRSDFNQNIGSWDVSNVNNMQSMFSNASFNQDIDSWDVSNVTNMGAMFFSSDFNQYIGSWDVSNVTRMPLMFFNSDFNQYIGSWDVGNVTNMYAMFYKTPFNQDIGSWDVSNVTNMDAMFDGSAFNQDIGSWDVSNVDAMPEMFKDTPFNQDIGSWDVGNVTNMQAMFAGSDFNKHIGSWDVSNVTDMSDIFKDVILSTSNYNNLLIGWSELSLQNNVVFDGGMSKYSSGAAADARQIIMSEFNWTVTDGGQSDSPGYLLTLSTNPDEGGSTIGGGQFEEGFQTNIETFSNHGWEFENWSGDTDHINDPYLQKVTVTMPADGVNLTANFAINTYAILAAPNDEEFGSVTGAGNYEHFEEVTLTAKPETGYHFVEWQENGEMVIDDEEPAGATYTFNAEEDRDLVAYFAINTYVITASAGEGGSIKPEGYIDIDHGGSQIFTIEAEEGYEILQVLVDGHDAGAVEEYEFTDLADNHTILAEFYIDETGLETLTEQVNVYPNPFNNTITITNASGLKNIRLKNLFGQTVFEKEMVGTDEAFINTKSLSPGVYVLRLTGTDDSSRVLKIMKE